MDQTKLIFTGTGQTVNATSVDLVTYPVPTNRVMVVEMLIIGRTSAMNVFTRKRLAGIKNVSGTLTSVASVAFGGQADAALSACALGEIISGTNFILRATGVAAQTIDWYGELIVWVN